jgi:hypothetical protein
MKKKIITIFLTMLVVTAGAVAITSSATQATPAPAIGCLHREIGNTNPGWIDWNPSRETHFTGLFRITKCGGGTLTFRSDGWRHLGGCGYIWAWYYRSTGWAQGPARFVCDGHPAVVLLSGQPQDRQYFIEGFSISANAGEPRWFMGAFDS